MKHTIPYFFVLMLCTASCNKMDINQIKPHYQQTNETVMRDSASAKSMVLDIYQKWRGDNLSHMTVGLSLASGALYAPIPDAFVSGSGISFQDNNITDAVPPLSWMYSNLYSIINSANITIEMLEAGKAVGLSEAGKKVMIAECRFHRAMAHFYLLRYFGAFWNAQSKYGVVVRETPYPEVLEAAPRSSVGDTYSSIIKDLKYAVENAPKMLPANQHYLVSRLTAKALQARVLLYMKDYAACETLAAAIINEADAYGYGLEEQYSNIFVKTYESKEMLFGLYVFGSKESYGFSILGTAYGGYTAKISEVGLPLDMDTGEGYDGRFAYAYKLDASDAISGNINSFSAAASKPADVSERKNHKYLYESSPTARGNSCYFQRLAEVYYIHAEAAARSNHYNAARSSLATVLNEKRIGRTMSDEIDAVADEALLEYIRKNKWIELFAENNEEWFDMIRYYYAGNLSMNNLTAIKNTLKNEKQLIMPIPRDAMAANNLLIQNPQ